MTFGKKIATVTAAAAFVALSAGSAFAVSAYASGSVNVRSGPGTGYHRIDTLQAGEGVDVKQCQDGWCYVEHRGPDGWVSANYLSEGGPRQVWPTPRPNVTFQFGFPGFGFQFGHPQPHPGHRPGFNPGFNPGYNSWPMPGRHPGFNPPPPRPW